MADLVWLEDANDDLQSIFDYIACDNISAAEALTSNIVSACDRLRDFPHSGRAYNRRYRVLVVGNHLVLYRHDGKRNEVIVAAVVDGRRDLRSLLKEFGASR